MLDETLEALLNACHKNPMDDTGLLVAADRAAELGMLSTEWVLRRLAWPNCHALRLPTGSRVYGTPKPDSDWDWVRLTHQPLDPFWENCERTRSGGSTVKPYEGAGPYGLSGSFRYGPINLIICETHKQFDCWVAGTSDLHLMKLLRGPVTREEAVAVFSRIRQEKL